MEYTSDEIKFLEGRGWENKGSHWSSQPLGFYWFDIQLKKTPSGFEVSSFNEKKHVATEHAKDIRHANEIASGMAESEINNQELREAKLAEKGPRGGNIIGKTQSGKPIYESHGNRNHKNFTKADHLDAARRHDALRAQASDDYHFKQNNGDGTVSDKQIKKRKQLRKQMDHHAQHAAAHRNSYEGTKREPDQRDFDRMDRMNDPDHRSKAWNRASAVEAIKLAVETFEKYKKEHPGTKAGDPKAFSMAKKKKSSVEIAYSIAFRCGSVSKEYKLRAECLADVHKFMEQVHFQGRGAFCYGYKVFGLELAPDVVLEFKSDHSLDEIKDILKSIPDSHVMLETVALKKDYTGERE